MKRIASLALLGLTLSSLSPGCKDDSAGKAVNAPANVAVVDLDGVGKAMGWNDELVKNMEQSKAHVTEQLESALRLSRDSIEQKKAEIAKAAGLKGPQIDQMNNAKSRSDLEALGLSSKQIDDLIQVSSLLSNDAVNAERKLNEVLQAQQQAIVRAYRNAAEPSVRRVALANNRSIVITPGPNLLFFDPAINLTDKVVDDLQHSNSGKVELPPIASVTIRQAMAPGTQPK